MKTFSIAARLRTMYRLLLVLLLLGGSVLPAHAQVWELVWADEFDTDGLPDATRWSYDVGGNGWGNNEAQYYTENRTENARVENGVLIIEALKESFGGNAYTSARLVSRDKGDWAYGKIKVRAKVPAGRGTWPAIWMLPTDWIYGNGNWPDNGEIDIMEHVGFDSGRIHGTVHNHTYNGLAGTQKGGSKTVSDATEAFHDYAIVWSPEQIDFSVDGVVYFRYFNDHRGWTTWPFDHPFHLILNLAIGGDWGGAQGIDDAIFPVRMEVDYVRVYENTALPEVTFTPPAPVDPGATLALSAGATIAAGSIAGVTFLQGNGVLGTVTDPPYGLTLTNVQPGCYRLAVRATDALGWSTTTPPVDYSVGSDCPQAPYLIAPHAVPGRIEAEYYDLGGGGEAYLDLDNDNQGHGIRLDEGVDIETTADDGGGFNVGWTASREWLEYTVDVPTAGDYTLQARVAATTGSGRFQVEVDGVAATGEVTVPATGDGQTWTTVSAGTLTLTEGLHTLRFRFLTGGFNLNYLELLDDQATATEEEEIPDGLALDGNYPNPFRGTTRIVFTLPHPMHVRLAVYDVIGRRVDTLLDGVRPAGRQDVTYDGRGLARGAYLLRLFTPVGRRTHPLLYLGG